MIDIDKYRDKKRQSDARRIRPGSVGLEIVPTYYNEDTSEEVNHVPSET